MKSYNEVIWDAIQYSNMDNKTSDLWIVVFQTNDVVKLKKYLLFVANSEKELLKQIENTSQKMIEYFRFDKREEYEQRRFPIKTCPICGLKFKAKRSYQEYCSKECMKKSYLRRKN
jgi:hypothetical protein